MWPKKCSSPPNDASLSRTLQATLPHGPIAASHLALNAVRGRERRGERNKQQFVDRLPVSPEIWPSTGTKNLVSVTALSRLSQHSATVLVLRHSGLSYAEVADAMGVKVGQVGTMLRRAEAALRKELDRATRS